MLIFYIVQNLSRGATIKNEEKGDFPAGDEINEGFQRILEK